MKQRLSKLKWEEISGVDAGANETPGWLLQKSKELGDEAQAFEKAVVAAAEAIGTDEVSLYFKGAGDDLTKALEEVRKHFEDGLEDGESTEDSADPITKGAVDKLIDLFKGRDSKEEQPAEKSEEKEDEKEDEESTEKSEEKESEEESTEKSEESEEESDTEKSEEGESTEKSEEKPEIDADAVGKALGEAVNKELEPIREAIVGLANRIEPLEKGTARSAGLQGQEGGEEKADKSEDGGNLAKAVTSALKNPGKKVTMK